MPLPLSRFRARFRLMPIYLSLSLEFERDLDLRLRLPLEWECDLDLLRLCLSLLWPLDLKWDLEWHLCFLLFPSFRWCFGLSDFFLDLLGVAQIFIPFIPLIKMMLRGSVLVPLTSTVMRRYFSLCVSFGRTGWLVNEPMDFLSYRSHCYGRLSGVLPTCYCWLAAISSIHPCFIDVSKDLERGNGVSTHTS